MAKEKDVAERRVHELEKQLSTMKRQLQEKEEELAAASDREDLLSSRLISSVEALSGESLVFLLFLLSSLICNLLAFVS